MIVTKVLPNVHSQVSSVWPSLDRVVKELIRDTQSAVAPVSQPLVNIIETNEAYRIELAAPGLQKEDFNLELNNNQLLIKVEKTVEAVEGEKVRRREFGFFNISRQFQLPATVDVTQIEGKYDAGVLAITLPKRPEARPQPVRKVEIS